MNDAKNKYQLQHEERRRQILTEAGRLFLERGLASVKMVDVADACGISRQTLYKYFNGIDEIIFTVQEQIIRRFGMRGEADLGSMLDHLFHYYTKNREDFFFTSLFDVYVHTHQIPESLIRRYHAVIHECVPDIRAILPTDGAVDSAPLDRYFIVAIHTVWAMITRMAILGQDYTAEYHITEEESFRILKNALCGYLKNNTDPSFK